MAIKKVTAGLLVALVVGMAVFSWHLVHENTVLQRQAENLSQELQQKNEVLGMTAAHLVSYVVDRYLFLKAKAEYGCFGWGNLGDDLVPAIKTLVETAGSQAYYRLVQNKVEEYFRICPPDSTTKEVLAQILSQ